MAHPYTTTIPGLVSAIRQLRSTFPNTVNADTLKKWSIAPNNEGTVLVVLRYLGLIDEEGKKQTEPAKVFVEHDDAAFASQFEGLVRTSYKDLFDVWADQAWTLDRDKMIGFFRTADDASARVGAQQAATFRALASLAGHGEAPAEPRAIAVKPKMAPERSSRARVARNADYSMQADEIRNAQLAELARGGGQPASLTVRIEINLPVSDKQEVYDNIFRSIRANLLNEPASK
jgi:hypothetical protein